MIERPVFMDHKLPMSTKHDKTVKFAANCSNITTNPPISVYPAPHSFVFPILMSFFAYYGSTIIHGSLPSIPFLFPTAILLIPMCAPSVPLIFRGSIKTILALFFIFAGVQNVLYFQVNQTFFATQDGLNLDLVNPVTLPKPVEGFLHFPQFLVLTSTDSLCTSTVSRVEQKYSKFISESADMNELSTNLATVAVKAQKQTADNVVEHTHDVDCIDATPLYTFGNAFTVALTPNNWYFPVKQRKIEKNDKVENTVEIPSNAISLLRARYTITERSGLPLPDFVVSSINSIFNIPEAKLVPDVVSLLQNMTTTPSAFITLYRNMTTFQLWIGVGLIFCLIGDVFLIFGGIDLFFLGGLVAFLLGHVGYSAAYLHTLFVSRVKQLPIFPMQCVFFVIFFGIVANALISYVKSGGKLKFPMNYAVVLYTCIISAMVCSSWLLAFAIPPSQQSIITYSPQLLTAGGGSPAKALADELQFKPIVHDSLLHVINIAVRVPMYVAADVSYHLGLTQHKPQDIAEMDLLSHHIVSAESWGYFFAALGSTLFCLSDVFVARQKFIKSSDVNTFIGLPLYFFAQLLIANTVKYQ